VAQIAKLCADGIGAPLLLDGLERDRDEEEHAWAGEINQAIEYRWHEPVNLSGTRLVFDSNLANTKRMPCTYPQKGGRNAVPNSLIKSFRLEMLDSNNQWQLAYQQTNNYQRLVEVSLPIAARGLRFVPEATWGAKEARIFSFEPLANFTAKIPTVPSGAHFSNIVARLDPQDLTPPENGLETNDKPARGA
jgi:hypothetical protein